jgi:hypothetical protein
MRQQGKSALQLGVRIRGSLATFAAARLRIGLDASGFPKSVSTRSSYVTRKANPCDIDTYRIRTEQPGGYASTAPIPAESCS